MVHRALSDKTYLSLGLLSPLRRSGKRCMTFGSSTFGMFILMISNPHVHNPVIMGIKFCCARGISLWQISIWDVGHTEKLVASAKYSKNLNGYLLRLVWISPPCFSFIRFIVEQCRLLKKNKGMTPAHSSRTTRSSHSAQYCRFQTYSGALKNYPPRTIPNWNSLSPNVANTQTTEEFMALLIQSKTQLKVVFVCPFFVCFVLFSSKFQN